MYVCKCMCVCIYIYIYRERERKRERERDYPVTTQEETCVECALQMLSSSGAGGPVSVRRSELDDLPVARQQLASEWPDRAG